MPTPLVLTILFLLLLLSLACLVGRQDYRGLTFFQRLIRELFRFARCAHGFACAMDAAFLAYRKGRLEYGGVPVNERHYPAEIDDELSDEA